MLIDWLTARLPFEHFTTEQQAGLRNLTDRIVRYCPQSGEIRYESQAWDSVRSDSHQVVFRVGTDAFWIQGSPARATADGCTVFGSGPSRALDLAGSLARMVTFVFDVLGDRFRPVADIHHWLVSRVDITGSLALGSLVEVRDALRILRNLEGGRYRVSSQQGDTVYWSLKSRLRKGKAYAKGPHLIHLLKNPDYTGRRYTADELSIAEKLLRLELTLGREYFRRAKPWHQLTADDLTAEWRDYFDRMIGGAEVTNDRTLLDRVMAAAPTAGQGKSAFGLWTLIKAEGWERAKEFTSKTTWYRHLQILRNAGLSDADFSAGRVVEFRRKIFEAQAVHSWEDLKLVA